MKKLGSAGIDQNNGTRNANQTSRQIMMDAAADRAESAQAVVNWRLMTAQNADWAPPHGRVLRCNILSIRTFPSVLARRFAKVSELSFIGGRKEE